MVTHKSVKNIKHWLIGLNILTFSDAYYTSSSSLIQNITAQWWAIDLKLQ